MNNNWVKFEEKTTASVEMNGKRNDLEVLLTTKKTNPLLGLDWMAKLGITLNTGETSSQINHVTGDPDITVLKKKFKKLFNENHTVNGLDVKNTIKRRCKVDTTKRKANTDSLATIVWKRNKQTHEARPL